MVCFCAEPRADGREKDTLRNCLHSGDFVVNVASDDLAEAINQTAADYPPEISELEAVGLTSLPGERVRSPRIAQCPISLECRVSQVLPLGQSGHRLVIGEVLLFHIRDDLYRDGEIDQQRLRPLARLAGNQYARLGEVFELDRPWRRQPS
jgi:flavin reductase (DIM6/NTAB) family NADH-FMN oxidoreductase RutF